MRKMKAYGNTNNKSQYFTMYNVQCTGHRNMQKCRRAQRIKRGDAIKLIETGILANSRIKRKDQSDKQFEYAKKKSNDNGNKQQWCWNIQKSILASHHSMTKSNEKLFDFPRMVHCVNRKQKKNNPKHFTSKETQNKILWKRNEQWIWSNGHNSKCNLLCSLLSALFSVQCQHSTESLQWINVKFVHENGMSNTIQFPFSKTISFSTFRCPFH